MRQVHFYLVHHGYHARNDIKAYETVSLKIKNCVDFKYDSHLQEQAALHCFCFDLR